MSKGESEFCLQLQWMEDRSLGTQKILKNQPNVFLTEAKIRVIPDWLIERNGKEIYLDYKGFESPSWRRNRKLWQHYGPAPLEVWKKKGTRFFCSETINPKEKK